MQRIRPIEGLRAYLAFWVVIAHLMAFSGWDTENFSGFGRLLVEGRLAVDLFMIVSGFVNFSLLDRREENYRQFVTRRFFRLYPVYILLFLVALALVPLWEWAIQQGPQYLTSNQALGFQQMIAEARHDWLSAVILHLGMLHGVVPDSLWGVWFKSAFLPPAWSVSLEWQFYLLAPLAYGLLTSKKAAGPWMFFSLFLLLAWLGSRFYWSESFFLLNPHFFLLGIMSYFIYARRGQLQGLPETGLHFLPALVAIAAVIFLLGARARSLIPLCLWLPFFGLLMENPQIWISRWLLVIFENRVTLYLGRVSYSIYLSHSLVIVVVQAALVKWIPGLGKLGHFCVLTALVLVLTVGVSALLYRFVEAPGMKLGKKVASRWGS